MAWPAGKRIRGGTYWGIPSEQMVDRQQGVAPKPVVTSELATIRPELKEQTILGSGERIGLLPSIENHAQSDRRETGRLPLAIEHSTEIYLFSYKERK